MDPQTPQNGNHSAHVQEQALETDFLPWKLPESPDEQLTTEKIRVDAEFYKRVGFYSAFNKLSEQQFRQSIVRLSKTIEIRIESLNKELTEDIERFESRKAEADRKTGEIKTSLTQYEQEVDQLRSELPALRTQLEILRGDIKKAVVEIGAKKETLISDRQDALLKEFDRLNSELENVVRKRMGLNEEIFTKQKDALEKKKSYWISLFEKYEQEHKEVLAKLRLFGVPGFHVLSSTFLYNAGLVAATVAGAFFASFAETNYFASGGVLSFIIQGLFAFSTGFLGQSTDPSSTPFTVKLSHAGVLLVIFLGLLALMFVVSWLCHFAYQQLVHRSAPEGELNRDNGSGDADMNAFAIEINMNNDLPVRAKVFEKTFFGFWIRAIPYLLFLAISFILVSMGTDIANIKSLDASMAGYGTGFLIALASGGISYIYLTMFLERRIEQRVATAQADRPLSWARLNVELIAVILAFITVVLIALLAFQHPFKSANNTQSLASLMFFAASCLLTAFVLGFGIRLQSLEASRRDLENSCDIIQTKLIRISRPLQMYLTPVENAHFNRRFVQIRDEIMNLMLARTMLTRRAIDTPLARFDEKRWFFQNMNKWLRGKLSLSDNAAKKREASSDQWSEHDPRSFSASEEIRLCFPKLEAELGVLEAELEETRNRIAFIDKEVKFRTEQKGEFYEKKLAELKHEEVRSRNYQKAIANRKRKFHYEAALEQRRKKFFGQKIVEGFELGNWFTKHGSVDTEVPEFVWNSNGDYHD